VGLPYGTVLELRDGKKGGLVPLAVGEDLIPVLPSSVDDGVGDGGDCTTDAVEISSDDSKPTETNTSSKNNSTLTDNNQSQAITQEQLHLMRSDPTISGQTIIQSIIQNSSTYAQKNKLLPSKIRPTKTNEIPIPLPPRALYPRDYLSSVVFEGFETDA